MFSQVRRDMLCTMVFLGQKSTPTLLQSRHHHAVAVVLRANLLAKMLAMTLLQITGIYDIKKKKKGRKNNLENLGKKLFDK